MKRANEWLAIHASAAFATMGCFWAFLILALIPLPFPHLMPAVQFVSSGVLQLVALPLISVAGVITGRSLAKQSEEQHAAVMEILADVRELQAEMHRLAGGSLTKT